MSGNLTHAEAIKALCDCAATVSVLSYQEAIEGYFKLRGLYITDAPPLTVARRAVGEGGERVPLRRAVYDWLRDDVPLAAKMVIMPEHVDALQDRLAAIRSPE